MENKRAADRIDYNRGRGRGSFGLQISRPLLRNFKRIN